MDGPRIGHAMTAAFIGLDLAKRLIAPQYVKPY
jgi:hypothetical protein